MGRWDQVIDEEEPTERDEKERGEGEGEEVLLREDIPGYTRCLIIVRDKINTYKFPPFWFLAAIHPIHAPR